MAIVSWNVRGLNRDEATRQARLLTKIYKPDVIFLMETKMTEGKTRLICNKLGFDHGLEVPRIGLSGGLMVLWKEMVEVTFLTSSPNHFSCFVRWESQPRAWHFSGFYGDPKVSNRHHTWELLKKLKSVASGPWLVMGDFNEILSQEDKEGGGVRSDSQIEAFRTSLEVCALQSLEYRGNRFTWIKNMTDGCIKERLDWAMANEDWLKRFPNNTLTHLDFFHSDHRALLLCLDDQTGVQAGNSRKRPRFRFENMWVKESDCKEIIGSSWMSSYQSALSSTINNIKQCTINLSAWNQEKFGAMAREIKEMHQQIRHLHDIQDRMDDKGELQVMEQKLKDLLYKEEVFWKQRSKILWLKAGDQNTKFFHQRANKRNKINTIKGLLNEQNEWCSDEGELGAIVEGYYEELFTSTSPSLDKIEELLSAVHPLVTEDMCRSLGKAFTAKEIKKAVFSMSTDKSPGPDGMNAMFYQQHWDIVGPLVSKAVLDCLNEEEHLHQINSTLVILIPKVKEPRAVSDFRPISLCNVLYKVVSKVIVNRLKPILPHIIYGTQSAFVPGRLMTDNALIAYECLHYLRAMKGGERCYVAMKLDMSKAYDRVEWIFIENMLKRVGFPQQWVKKMMKCVTSVHYSFQINGRVCGNVIPTRGLRQGDPLSPYLFLICAEGFSALLRQAESRRDILGLKIARNAPSISHLFFADDSLLFIKASARSLQSIQNIFSHYADCSGQMINFNKSQLYFSPNTREAVRADFTAALNMQTTEAIETYLGLPMIGGKNKKIMFRSIKDRIWVKLHSWRHSLFSQGGKEILLKAVIQAMPTFSMSCFRIPEGQCQEIEKLIARYWWGSFNSTRKIHWRAWKKMSIPKSEGGLGFRSLVQYNQALLAKQAWRILTNPTSLIANVLQAKYFSNSSFLEAREGSGPSLTWRSICWGKSLLQTGIRRRIGNGQNTLVFKDPWIPRPPSFLPITKGSNENMKVFDLIQQPGRWNIEVIQQNLLSLDTDLILKIPLSPFNHSDSWVWHYTSKGHYSVKSGYNLAISVDKSGESSSSNVLLTWWKAYWGMKIPRKMLYFGWRGFHEILPTTKGLFRRNVSKHSNCPLCGYGEDSNAHAVFWCPLSQELWALLDYPFLIGHKEEISFKNVLLYASELMGGEAFSMLVVIAWGLWTERNKKTHGQQTRTSEQLKRGLISLYDEIKKAEEPESTVRPGEGRSRERGQQEVNPQDLALYVDAAISMDTNTVGLGAAIITADKRVQATLSKPLIGNLSALNAEALALLVGLQWVQNVGLPLKTFFSDSLSVVQALENIDEYHNEFGTLLADIKSIMSNIPGASISHVSRNLNSTAHNLAKQALQLETESSWMEEN